MNIQIIPSKTSPTAEKQFKCDSYVKMYRVQICGNRKHGSLWEKEGDEWGG